MNDVSLIWITPDAEKTLVHTARVSNPKSQEAGTGEDRLIRYLLRHNHMSPFEMVAACIEVNTTRDIGRQILRHKSFSFQEFSQRYAEPDQLLMGFKSRQARMQVSENRQSSAPNQDGLLEEVWYGHQTDVLNVSMAAYKWAISKGIAKEVARAVLPEGLTPTRMYMTGSFRSWIHYLAVRMDPSTQMEHRDIAHQIYELLVKHAPTVFIHGVHEAITMNKQG